MTGAYRPDLGELPDNDDVEPRLAPAPGSDIPELFVEVRLYNRPGIYRVLSIGDNGQKDSDMDAARILRKLALWLETKDPNNKVSHGGER